MKKQSISIIIPVYNNERGLEACVTSLYKQKRSFLEVIIIDNNSNDNTSTVISSLQKKYDHLFCFFQRKKGRGAARKTGITHAKGDIIVMIDSDCIATEDWLSSLTKPILSGKESIAVGSFICKPKTFWEQKRYSLERASFKKSLVNGYLTNFWSGNCAFRKDITNYYSFDPQLVASEDLDFYMVLKKEFRIAFIPLAKVFISFEKTFFQVLQKSFIQGYWHTVVYYKYFKKTKDHYQFSSQSFFNFITFFPWVLLLFVKKPFGMAFYLACKEFSWRVGVIKGKIDHFIKHFFLRS